MSTKRNYNPRPAKAHYEFEVRWEIQISATGPREAAMEALRIHRDPASIATVFQVRRSARTPEQGSLETIDLDADDLKDL